MQKVQVTESLRTMLGGFSEVVEICDESGEPLARVIPYAKELDPTQWEATEPPPLSEEEMERRRNETEWYTTEEVLAYLENL